MENDKEPSSEQSDVITFIVQKSGAIFGSYIMQAVR